jgi:hypothetical protein
MDLCFLVALAGALHQRQRLGEDAQPSVGLAGCRVGLGQQQEETRPRDPCASRLLGGETLLDLRDPLLELALHGENPPAQHRAEHHPVGKPLLARKRDRRLRLLLGEVPLAAELVEHRREEQHGRQRMRIGQLAGQVCAASLRCKACSG